MLEKYADFSFDAQRDLFEVFGIFNKMLTFASSPYLLQAEEDYVEKGAGLAYAMFSNYENLNTDEKKSAVSHFISEMQMADDTLPLPITKPSFSERINMELQNYYAAKNNPDTNDTVEDSIDAFFGNIPLYNYLNAIFAPTERERKRNLIRGIESSLRAIENLPYTSSMMGDISIVHPYPAVVPDVQPYADTTPEPFPPAADSAGNYLKPQGLMDELAQSGVKFNADDIIFVTKTPNSKLMWLEKGNSASGLEHITKRHASQFVDRGINDIAGFLNKTLQEMPLKTGVNPQGPFSDYLINGNRYRIVYGTNGYIVSFFPIK